MPLNPRCHPDARHNDEGSNEQRIYHFAQRLKCGTAEKRRPERSELAVLSAAATTDLFAVLFMPWSRVEALAMQTYTTRIPWGLIVWRVNAVALKIWLKMKEGPLLLRQLGKVAMEYRHLGPILSQ